MNRIRVSTQIGSDFTTITEAIDAAMSGTKIIIEPGVYHESFAIEKDVELIGNGMREQIVIESPEAVSILINTPSSKLSNLTVKGVSAHNQYGVYIEQGNVHFTNCVFSSTEAGVGVLYEHSSAVFENCCFKDSNIGLLSFFGSKFTMSDCVIERNAEIGMKVSQGSDPSVNNTVFRENGTGIVMEEGARGTLKQCEITSSEKGVVLTSKAAPILQGCALHHNDHSLILSEQAIGIIRHCTITDSQQGIDVSNNGVLHLTESRVERNQNMNLSVIGSSIQMKDCHVGEANIGAHLKMVYESSILSSTFIHHDSNAIQIEEQNDLQIMGCQFKEDVSSIRFQSQATGIVKECEIIAPELTGIVIVEESTPTIANCTVRDGKIGLFLKNSKGVITHSRFVNHSYMDILTEGAHETVLEQCTFNRHNLDPDYHQASANTDQQQAHQEADTSETLASLVKELNSYIGLERVKSSIADLLDFLSISKAREEAGLSKADSMSYHSLFLGNPGTGKTTMARLVSKIYYRLGIIKNDICVEVDRGDLVGEFVGQTAVKTNKVLKKAEGGVLFIDEAYSLVKPNSNNDFGQEALEIILKRMEDDKSFIVFAAGYPEEMTTFINGNPGLKERFTNHLYFDDYTSEQLVDIFVKQANDEDYLVEVEGLTLMEDEFTEYYRKRDRTFGNARLVRNIFTQVKMVHAKRCNQLPPGELTTTTLMTLTTEDIKEVLHKSLEKKHKPIPVNEVLLKECLAELEGMIGLANVKKEINELVKLVKFYREEEKDYTGKFVPHTVFLGNPGTGKTTVARLLSKIYEALGILPIGNLLEVTRQDLVAGHIGQTAIKTAQVLDRSVGSTLFIDEAYSLAKNAQSDFGQEAIDTLLKRMEDDRGRFSLIVAGYTDEMKEFLYSNPGLRSRFGREILFEDYTPSEMLQIAKKFAQDEGFLIEETVLADLLRHFEEAYQTRDRYFSNGRFVRNIIEGGMKNVMLRMADTPKEERTNPLTITWEDFA